MHYAQKQVANLYHRMYHLYMESKWSKHKPVAIRLRKQGHSLRDIERELSIPRSTLSGWFATVQLTAQQKNLLEKRWKDGLVRARKNAVVWHNTEKNKRLMQARQEAHHTLSLVHSDDVAVLELALSVLYLAEGFKKNIETGIGSSDPRTLRFFIAALKRIYNFDISNVRCELYLRYDHNPQKIKEYWSQELDIPLQNFKQVNIDKRTAGKASYAQYKGVCSLRCGNVAIQRRLVYLAEGYFDTISEQNK